MDIKIASSELRQAKKLFENSHNNITIFGSARVKQDSELAKEVYDIAKMFSNRGYNVLTGGGPGIMQAGSHGAFDGASKSIGLNIDLPNEQQLNPYLNEEVTFEHFQTRKAMLMLNADAFIIFPGGYGTIDELLEVLTLIQTKKMQQVPIFLYNSEFWKNQIVQFKLQARAGYISNMDLDLFKVINSLDELLLIMGTDNILPALRASTIEYTHNGDYSPSSGFPPLEYA